MPISCEIGIPTCAYFLVVGATVVDVVVVPTVVDPAVVDPAVVDPAVVDPAVVDPAVVEPAVVDPAVVDPGVVGSAARVSLTLEVPAGLVVPTDFVVSGALVVCSKTVVSATVVRRARRLVPRLVPLFFFVFFNFGLLVLLALLAWFDVCVTANAEAVEVPPNATNKAAVPHARCNDFRFII
jgi:hypothetical protein